MKLQDINELLDRILMPQNQTAWNEMLDEVEDEEEDTEEEDQAFFDEMEQLVAKKAKPAQKAKINLAQYADQMAAQAQELGKYAAVPNQYDYYTDALTKNHIISDHVPVENWHVRGYRPQSSDTYLRGFSVKTEAEAVSRYGLAYQPEALEAVQNELSTHVHEYAYHAHQVLGKRRTSVIQKCSDCGQMHTIVLEGVWEKEALL